MIEIRETTVDGPVITGRLELAGDGRVLIRDAGPGLVEFLTEYAASFPGSKPERIVGTEDGAPWLRPCRSTFTAPICGLEPAQDQRAQSWVGLVESEAKAYLKEDASRVERRARAQSAAQPSTRRSIR